MSLLPCGDSRLTLAQRQGATAENSALQHLQAQGLQLLARNVRFRCGELDLVMRDRTCIVFIEVRFRRPSRFGSAALTVDARKQARIRRAASAWLGCQRDAARMPCRFDVVAIDGGHLDWITNAF
jgi:putative endonuclease